MADSDHHTQHKMCGRVRSNFFLCLSLRVSYLASGHSRPIIFEMDGRATNSTVVEYHHHHPYNRCLKDLLFFCDCYTRETYKILCRIIYVVCVASPALREKNVGVRYVYISGYTIHAYNTEHFYSMGR